MKTPVPPATTTAKLPWKRVRRLARRLFAHPAALVFALAAAAPAASALPDAESAIARRPDKFTPVISFSPLHVFATGGDLKDMSGWGGVISADAFLTRSTNPIYVRLGVDLTFFEATGNETLFWENERFDFSNELWHVGLHVNTGVGVHIGMFDVGGWVGFGAGNTETRGTPYNWEGRLSSYDFDVQAGFQIAFSPIEALRIFAGYRLMWNASATEDEGGYYDGYGNWYRWRSRYGRECPRVVAHSVELGLSYAF